MPSKPHNATVPRTDARRVLAAISALESHMIAMDEGCSAIAILAQELEDRKRGDPHDLHSVTIWIADRLDFMAAEARNLWEEANSLAYDVAYPDAAAKAAALAGEP